MGRHPGSKKPEVREVKIRYKNNADESGLLTCDCGNDEWELALSDEQGDAFECVKCGRTTRYFTEVDFRR